MMHQSTASTVRIANVTTNSTIKTLRTLVNAIISGKSAPANALPSGQVLQVIITPSANIHYLDMYTRDQVALLSGVSKVFPCRDALDIVGLVDAATVAVEIYIEENTDTP